MQFRSHLAIDWIYDQKSTAFSRRSDVLAPNRCSYSPIPTFPAEMKGDSCSRYLPTLVLDPLCASVDVGILFGEDDAGRGRCDVVMDNDIFVLSEDVLNSNITEYSSDNEFVGKEGIYGVVV
jgi:hypothetical protein